MTNDPTQLEVLVTGGTGFVGGHCLLQLLQAGYRVRTTVRSLARREEVLALLREGGIDPGERLTFVETDLGQDRNWSEAVAGCTFVLHVASPISLAGGQNEENTIRPAVDGTLRVLRAARDAGVKRVVVTSSFAAVGYSGKSGREPFTEEDWTDPSVGGLSAYVRSKAIAEKAAWDFVRAEAPGLELTTVNPTAIFGPSLGPDISSAFEILQGLLEGRIKACPRIDLSVVDVRDVADLHLRAMTAPAAAGQRFLATSGEVLSLPAIAALLRARLGDAAARVPTRALPNLLVRVLALFRPPLRPVAQQLGKRKEASNAKARQVLGWKPRGAEEAILASARSLLYYGLIKGQPHA
jgi:dihydroflavonol-4-reductase